MSSDEPHAACPVTAAAIALGRMNAGNGMMSVTEMANLTKTTGAAFDLLWVIMMITHHKGAVAMANP